VAVVTRRAQVAHPVRVAVQTHGGLHLGEVDMVLTDGRTLVRLDLPIMQPDGGKLWCVAEHAACIEYEDVVLAQAGEWKP
jgi:hypothetical protein